MNNQILSEVKSGNSNIGVITLNRPEKLNALSFSMIKDITNILLKWKDDERVDAVVINSSSPKAFCAGGDIKYIYENGPTNIDKSINFFQTEYALNHLIYNYPKPYIALLNGISMGGGLGISLHGSYRIAKNDLKMAMPETKIGFFPDVGGTYFLSRMKNNMGTYMALTGAVINSDTAKHYSLVDCILSEEDFSNALDNLVSLDKSELSNLDSHFKSKHGNDVLAINQTFINACKAANYKQFIEKLSDEKLIGMLTNLSPLSLVISYHSQKNAPTTFEECMNTEFFLTQEFIRDTEFYEGIRAMVVEKNSPAWTYSLTDVTSDIIFNYFTDDNKKRLEFYEI